MKYCLLRISFLLLVGLLCTKASVFAMGARDVDLEEKPIIFMSLKQMFPDEQHRKLAKAAGRGQIKVIDQLVENGIDVNKAGSRNATALFWAMGRNNVQGFKQLLEYGADPNIIFGDGGTVMHWAVIHKESDEFLKLALEYGGDPNLKAGFWNRTPIFDALSEKYSNRMDILINAGADVNIQGKQGKTLMHVACILLRFDLVYKLLNLGADYTIKESRGYNLAAEIASGYSLVRKDSEAYVWMQKVIEWLDKKGEKLPQVDDHGRLIK